MKKFQIWHFVDRVASQMAMGKGAEAHWPTDYYHVADVQAEDVNDVFVMTNNSVSGNWCDRKGIYCHVAGVPRSTTIGDVCITEDERVYRYTLSGQEELTEGKLL